LTALLPHGQTLVAEPDMAAKHPVWLLWRILSDDDVDQNWMCFMNFSMVPAMVKTKQQLERQKLSVSISKSG